MSTTQSASPYIGNILVDPMPVLVASRRERSSSHVLRRRPTMSQGQALEKLGRAIEYLYDSQVYQSSGDLTADDVQAVQTLMRLSREVFVECRDVVPAGFGVKHWLLNLLSGHRAA